MHTLFKSITFVEVVALRSPFAGNPAHSELLPPREGKITSAGDKEVDGASSAIVPESGVELCQVKRQIERPSLLRALLTNRHINCRRQTINYAKRFLRHVLYYRMLYYFSLWQTL